MGQESDELAPLRNDRLAAHAVQAAPVWLWSTDGRRVLWANSAGRALLGHDDSAIIGSATIGAATRGSAPNESAGRERRSAPPALLAAQIARLGATLYPTGVTSLQRLRGLGWPLGGRPLGRPLLCACTRLALREGAAVLVVAQEPVGRPVPLAERLRRLCEGVSGPVAVIGRDGRRLAANAAAVALLGDDAAPDIALVPPSLVPPSLVAAALAGSVATGDTPHGPVELIRLGGDGETMLLVRLPPALVAPRCVPEAAGSARPETSASDVPPAVAPEQPAEAPLAEPAGPAAPPVEAAQVETVQPETVQPETAQSEIVAAEPDGAAPPALRIDAPVADRRQSSLRFVWRMDADGRFTLGSDAFTDAIGPRVAVALGRPWDEIAAVLGLDPEGRVQRAVEARDTWSGIVVSFPVDGSDERLAVELSGLPVYDRERRFLGYRGFGVCRDTGRLATIERLRRAPGLAPTEPSGAAGVTYGRRAGDHDPVEPVPEQPIDGGRLDGAPAAPSLLGTGATASAAAAPESPAPENVVRFPAAAAAPPGAGAEPRQATGPGLSLGERDAFREIARQLNARLAGEAIPPLPDPSEPFLPGLLRDTPSPPPDAVPTGLLDRLPVGVLLYRFDELLYANRSFLETTGYADLAALAAAGGLDSLFVTGDADLAAAPGPAGQSLAILTRRGDRKPVAARLFTLPWNGETVFALVLATAAVDERNRAGDLALRRAEATIRELHGLLDTAFDGVVVLTSDGRIVSANHSAEVLFGADAGGLVDQPFEALFVPDGRKPVRDLLARVRGTGRMPIDGAHEVVGLVRGGGALPLSLALGPMADGSDRLCAVFRDLTPARRLPPATPLRTAPARPEAGAAADRDEFLAKLGHGLRSPLTVVLGFAELMLEERFGPIGNERYRAYLRDVRTAAQQMTALIDDMVNLTRAESGTLELTFVSVDLNDVVQAAVKTMQPQANRERIIIRSALAPRMPPIVADLRSLDQIIANLIANAIRLTGPGGQVIVSTGVDSQGRVVLRVRDTGVGLSGKELETVLHPFARQATAPATGDGVGLPLTKALAEANRGTFHITSRANDGTLVEVTFPRPKIPAE